MYKWQYHEPVASDYWSMRPYSTQTEHFAERSLEKTSLKSLPHHLSCMTSQVLKVDPLRCLCTLCRHSFLAALLLFWIRLDCGTLSCSAITIEPRLSVKCRPRGAFTVASQVGVDDKSFPVSELSCTHGSLLCPRQPVKIGETESISQRAA